MKRLLLYFIMLFAAIPFAAAEDLNVEKQRYMVASKKGHAKFVEVKNVDGKWQYVGQPPRDTYPENGTEFEGFEISEDTSLNYVGTEYVWQKSLIAELDGKFYKVVFPEKDIKPVDENGDVTTALGWRVYLSNTVIGDFYRTWIPCIIGFSCALLAGIIILMCMGKAVVPMSLRLAYAVPMCVISVMELGAFFSVGTDATWWVKPEDVGYWIATPMLIPYSIAAAMMIFSYKLYGTVGKLHNPANFIVSALLIIGIILTVISVIFTVCDFIGAVLTLIGAAWLFKGNEYKDGAGNTINSGPLGTYKTDIFGKTTRIR